VGVYEGEGENGSPLEGTIYSSPFIISGFVGTAISGSGKIGRFSCSTLVSVSPFAAVVPLPSSGQQPRFPKIYLAATSSSEIEVK